MTGAELAGDSPGSRSTETEAAAAFISRAVGWVMVGSGVLGLGAAALLTIEKFRVLEDPSYVPACTVDAVLSCGSVMASSQSEAFGFPNPLLGIAGFAALAMLGVVVASGARLDRRIWIGLQLGMTLALGFVGWLIFQSTYRIEALCPYCMVVWVATIVGFIYVTLANLVSQRITVPAALQPVETTAIRFHGVLVTAVLLVLVALIGEAFWDYWMGA